VSPVRTADDPVCAAPEARRRATASCVSVGRQKGDAAAIAVVGKQLKRRRGSGGTAKNGVVEIQGDHVKVVMELLLARGLTVKRAGG